MHFLFLENRLADKHACSECTQEHKSVADWIPAASTELNSETAVVCMIVKITESIILKLVKNIAMSGINILSHVPDQAWLGFVEC